MTHTSRASGIHREVPVCLLGTIALVIVTWDVSTPLCNKCYIIMFCYHGYLLAQLRTYYFGGQRMPVAASAVLV